MQALREGRDGTLRGRATPETAVTPQSSTEPVRAMRSGRRRPVAPGPPLLVAAVLLTLCGCVQEMADAGHIKPFESSDFFEDERVARLPVEGTVALGDARLDRHLHTGMVGGQPAATYPFEVTLEVLERGRERYDIFCSPCHDRLGNGNGMVVQRGFRRPSSFHLERLRQAPPGYFFDVMTNGFGAMPSYAAQVPARDRWAIVAYIAALQLSQGATLEDVPADQRQQLEQQR